MARKMCAEMRNGVNLLLTSIGKRIQLIEHLKTAFRVVGADASLQNAARHFTDAFYQIPRCREEGYIEVKNDVKRLVKIELAAANKKFRMFAGPHEGAGIIQEEVVEAAKEMNGLRRELNAMWIGVYSNNPQISTKGVYDRAVALAVEAIQTAAMARKFERSQRRHWPGAKEPHYGEGE